MSYEAELYIMQTLFGVIPRDLWINNQTPPSADPFQTFSEEDKRIAKRKFRKLKRRAGVKKHDTANTAWFKINRYLQRINFSG